MGVILCAHSVCGEPRIQHNTSGEVATTSPPFYNELHWSHVPCVRAAPGTNFTSWSQHHFVVIEKLEWHVCKASHCSSKQQQSSPDEITLLLLVRTTYISVFFAHIPFVWNRAFSATPAEWLQQQEPELMFQNFSELEQESLSQKQKVSRSLKIVTPLISVQYLVRYSMLWFHC